MIVQQVGHCLHVDPIFAGKETFGLFDDDATVEGLLQLLAGALFTLGAPLGDQSDGCDVCEGPPDEYVAVVQFASSLGIDVQCSDRLIGEPHRELRDGTEAELECDGPP